MSRCEQQMVKFRDDGTIELFDCSVYVPSDRMDQLIDDNERLIDRNLVLECELAQLKAKLSRVVDMARDLHSDARMLSELFADGVMPEEAARECAVKHGMAERIMEAIA